MKNRNLYYSFWFWALISIISIDSIKAQDFFNILPDVGGLNMQGVCRIIISDNSSFYVVGHRFDTVGPGDSARPWIGEFNYAGDLLRINSPTDSLYNEPFYPDKILYVHKSGPFYYLYVPRDLGTDNFIPYLCEIDIRTGKIVKSVLLPNIDYPNEINGLCAIDIYQDTINLLSFAFVNDSIKIYLTQVDTLFENKIIIKFPQVLQKLYPLYLNTISNHEFEIIGDGTFGAGTNNEYINTYYLYYNSVEKKIISKFVPGEMHFSFGLSNSMNIVKERENNNWIIAANYLYDKTDSCSQCYTFIPFVYALNSQFDSILWKTRFYDETFHFGDDYELYSLTKWENSYFVAGNYRKTIYDSIPSSGLIIKCSINGDSLWMKHYIPLNWDGDRVLWAKLRNIKALSDGTIMAVGEIADKELQIIRPWILHLDENGCLIPGCNLVGTSKDDLDRNSGSRFIIFPNPANQELIIQSNENSLFFVNVNLISMSGTILKKSKFIPSKGNQYFLSLEGVPSGIYNITLSDDLNKYLTCFKFYHFE